jgi:hypothetical protein
MGDTVPDGDPRITWEHLDYYVRRHGGDLYLVETLLKQVQDRPDQAEICTFYYTPDQLTPEWAEALHEQGEDLQEFKSADFAPPDEVFLMRGLGRRDPPE